MCIVYSKEKSTLYYCVHMFDPSDFVILSEDPQKNRIKSNQSYLFCYVTEAHFSIILSLTRGLTSLCKRLTATVLRIFKF